jgi:lipid II:glycine glycyltransferase (peptidoglycan interpeptide bridge formation enzyme)
MGKLTQQTVLRFRQAFSRYCRQEGIISEFAHLHPWHSCTALLMRDGIAFNREIVYVDLNASTRELWLTHLNHACKKNIKRSLNEKVEVFAATTADEIGEFYRIYTATMERNGAAPSYFFPLSYFIAFHATMPKNAQFMLAAYEGKIIAGTLYLYDRHDIYSYLGGADHEYQQVRPTNAVIYHTIRWGQWQTMSRLILGGGYEPDDGIFRFKATFSPLRANFFTYKRIHRRRSYTQLCESWAAQYGETIDGSTFFPAYRSQPEK